MSFELRFKTEALYPGSCIGYRIARKVIETFIISMGPYVPPVGFSSPSNAGGASD